jgi:hypothetical protein
MLRAGKAAGKVLLVGRPSFFWADSLRVFPSDTAIWSTRFNGSHNVLGALLREDGSAEPLVAPVPARRMIRPLLVTDSSQTAHLFWAEAGEAEGDISEAVALWHASYRKGSWSDPHELLRASRVRWLPDMSVALAVGNDLHVFTTVRRPEGLGAAHVQRQNGTWKTTITRIPGAPSELDALALASDTVLLAFVASDPRARVTNGQHVFVSTVTPRDSIRSPATRIQWSGLDGSRLPKLFNLFNGTRKSGFVVFWGHVSRRSSGIDTIFAMTSDRGAQVWKPASALVLPAAIESIAMRQDRSGAIHLLGVEGQGAQARIFVSQWRSGTWAHVQYLGSTSSPLVTLSAIGNDTLIAAWNVRRPSSAARGAVLAPVTVVSYRVPYECDNRTRR